DITVQKQMEFWPDPEELQQNQNIWENLNRLQQEKIITALSRLVKKYACLEITNQTREANHDE
ncbi:MAG: hypothetical protein PF495_16095, partial [Spirochaetales bacterium]|nr:hypothetical protein [Spirochaetales bacterium]